MFRLRTTASLLLRPSCRWISDSLKKELEKVLEWLILLTITANDVVVFMKGTRQAPQCGFSRAVVQILELQGVDGFKTVNVLEDQEVRAGIKEFSSWPTIPQVYVKGEFLGGCDIMLSMFQNGELASFLSSKGIAVTVEEPRQEQSKQ